MMNFEAAIKHIMSRYRKLKLKLSAYVEVERTLLEIKKTNVPINIGKVAQYHFQFEDEIENDKSLVSPAIMVDFDMQAEVSQSKDKAGEITQRLIEGIKGKVQEVSGLSGVKVDGFVDPLVA